MTVSISNLNFTWSNSNTSYIAVGANVNTAAFNANSRFVSIKADGEDVFVIESDFRAKANTFEVTAANNEIVSLGNMMTNAIINGDYYVAINAKWDGVNWQRIDITNPSWLWQFNVGSNLIFEPAKYMTLWRCAAGTNPIGNFAAIDGWLLLQSFSQWGDATLGGYGMEIDGNGTVPFGRIRHATVSSVKYTDLITNSYLDESNVDNSSYPSYSCGIIESASFEGFKVRRAPAASGSPVWDDLFIVDDEGFTQFGNGKLVSSLPAANSALTGKMCWVKDANTPLWGETLIGGGSANCVAFCNGSSWIAR